MDYQFLILIDILIFVVFLFFTVYKDIDPSLSLIWFTIISLGLFFVLPRYIEVDKEMLKKQSPEVQELISYHCEVSYSFAYDFYSLQCGVKNTPYTFKDIDELNDYISDLKEKADDLIRLEKQTH